MSNTTTLTKSYLRGRWLWEAEVEGKVVESGWAATPEEAEADYTSWASTYLPPLVSSHPLPPGRGEEKTVPLPYEGPFLFKDQITSSSGGPTTITTGSSNLFPITSTTPIPVTGGGSAIYGPNLVSMMRPRPSVSYPGPGLNPNGTFKIEKKENLGGVIWNALGECARPFLAGLDSVDKKLALTPVVTSAHNATDYEVLRNQIAVDRRMMSEDALGYDPGYNQITLMAHQLGEMLPDIIKACGGVLHQFSAPFLLSHGLDPSCGVAYNMTFQWVVMKAPPAEKKPFPSLMQASTHGVSSSSTDCHSLDALRYAMKTIKKNPDPPLTLKEDAMRAAVDRITADLADRVSFDFVNSFGRSVGRIYNLTWEEH